MILPEKHVNLAESYFGFSGFLLQFIKVSITVDDLWKTYRDINNSQVFDAYHTFDDFILAIDFLYLIGAVNQNEKGEIFYEANKLDC